MWRKGWDEVERNAAQDGHAEEVKEDETGTREKIGLNPNTISPPGPILISSALLRYKVYEPVLVVGSEKFANIDIRLRVKGGGHVSQLYALRQAIAKGIVA
jgi:ribosomal protein S9